MNAVAPGGLNDDFNAKLFNVISSGVRDFIAGVKLPASKVAIVSSACNNMRCAFSVELGEMDADAVLHCHRAQTRDQMRLFVRWSATLRIAMKTLAIGSGPKLCAADG